MTEQSTHTVSVTRGQQIYASWTADVLVYTIVLNLFVEYVDEVEIESFTISILTAVLLKLMLVVLGGVEHRVSHFCTAKGTTPWRLTGLVLVFTILFGGKLLILEVVNLIFGDKVELGHFAAVVALILTMMVARKIMDWTYARLGSLTAGPEPS